MANEPGLESLYREAKSALKDRDYDRASDLLRQILLVDENYKDASRLLAQAVKLKRRRWHSHPLLWGALGLVIVLALGFFIAPRLKVFSVDPPTQAVATTSPTVMLAPTMSALPTETLLPTATPIPLTWKRISLGQEFERDTVTTLVIDPQDPEVLYVGMQNAGIYKSIDGGLSWRPAHQGLSNAHVISLVIDFQDSQVLYAGTYEGIYQTENGGETWLRIGEGTHVLMDPQDSPHLYARDDGNIYESADQGKNWRDVYSTREGCPNRMDAWAIHPAEGTRLFIVSEQSDECEQGLYMSSDGGNTWILAEQWHFCTHELSVGLDSQGDYFTVDTCEVEYSYYLPLPTPDSVYSYWDADQRLYKESRDGKQRLILGKPDVGYVKAVAISPGDPDTVYAAGAGIAVSRDGGLTWTKLNNGLGNTLLAVETGDRGSLSILSGNCQEDWSSEEHESKQSLFYSPDGGQTWNLASRTGCYLVKDADGHTVYRITNAVESREGSTIYWIWRSRDQGKSWERIVTPISADTLTADAAQSGLLYLHFRSNRGEGVNYHQYVSEDYGHKWRARNPEIAVKPCHGSTLQFIDAYRPMAADPFDGNHVFVIDNGALLESHDSCETTAAFATAPNTSMNSVAFDSQTPNMLYAGTDEGAYVSFDGAHTWHQINDGLLGATVVYSIVVDEGGQVYAATPYGIFKLEED